ncbi:class I SAM-dependent methyltransferase [Paraliobacillus zengyii]|uniref:class I SAM-dependent methyltransferase n=1 Tax=Paraliobacillus zengyii TaxID=2213194 RepID=UPI001E52C657|nr:class I SAM-dependent methyltransferase [Paraliobacillus zengyii]
MATTNWQRQDVTEHYLEQIRGAVPYGADQAKIMLQVINHFSPNPKKVIDLGCGNGFLAEILLKTYPDAHALLLDHSEPMIQAATEHMHAYSNRCDIIHADLSNSIEKFTTPNSIDCIVSGFVIHHLPHERKRNFIERYIIF